MRLVESLPITLKLLVAPAFAGVMTLAVGAALLWSHIVIDRAAEAGYRIGELRAGIGQALLDLNHGHAALFRAVSWKQSNVEQRMIDEAIGQTVTSLDAVARRVAALGTANVAADFDPAILRQFSDELAAYRSAVDATLAIIPTDGFLAAMFISDAHVKSGTLEQAGSRLAEAAESLTLRITADAAATMDTALYGAIGATVLALLLSAAAALAMGREISRPVRDMTRAMRALAGGDRAVAVPATGRRDEIGEMANAVLVFKENMIRNDELASEVARQQEERDRRAALMTEVTHGFDASVTGLLGSLADASERTRQMAGTMSAAAEQAGRQASIVATASAEASVDVQTVAAATEELSGSIAEIGRQVAQATEIIRNAVTTAEQANGRILGLTEAAERIGAVVQLITAIAEQTNLLALNATIEAARAGDAGRGFAVVAAEVKALATQTAQATGDITAQVGAMQSITRDTASAIRHVGETIGEAARIATSIAAAVEQQGSATSEIARNIEHAATGAREVSSGIRGVDEAAKQTDREAQQLRTVAADLLDHSDRLRRQVETFLDKVRAA